MSTGGKLPHGDRRKTFADVSLGIRAGRWAPKAGGLRISAVLEIMKNSTVGSFCKGRANFFHGAMGVQLDPDSIEVSIYDNDLCGKAAFVRMKDSYVFTWFDPFLGVFHNLCQVVHLFVLPRHYA